MHDFTHVARLVELVRGIVDGQMPARWSDNFGFGYGMPLFHFYGPLAYYIAAIFHFAGFSAVSSIKIVVWLNFFAGFIFMYWLSKEFFGKWGGILSALTFVYAPYRAAQFYVRGSLGEMTAMTLLPLAFLGIYKIQKEINRKSISKKGSQYYLNWSIVASLSIAGIFLSHNVIALFSIPFLLCWILAFFVYFILRKKRSWKLIAIRTCRLLLVGLFSFGLSSWYIVPAFFEKGYTIVDSFVGGGFSYYKLHFIYLRQLLDPTFEYGGSVLGPYDDISFQLGLVQISLLLFSGVVFGFWMLKKIWKIKAVSEKKKTKFEYRKKKADKNLSSIFHLKIPSSIIHHPSCLRLKVVQVVTYLISSVSLLFSIFMMTFHSAFVWDAMPIIQIAQFPWRLLTYAAFYVSLMIGLAGWYMHRLLIKKRPLVIIAVLIISITLIVVNSGFFKPEKYSHPEEYYYTDLQKIRFAMSDILKDYLPIWAETVPEPGLYPVSMLGGYGRVYNFQTKTGYSSFTAETETDLVIQLRKFYFPGWKIFSNGEELLVKYDNPNGFMEFKLSPGKHKIIAKLGKTSLQQWSDLLGSIAWIGILVFVASRLWFKYYEYKKN